MLAMLIAKGDLYNGSAVSLLGFSLGSIFAYSCLTTLYDLECRDKIGDVCFIGSTVDMNSFSQNIHKLIGSKGVIQGKLTVCFTKHDSILAYLFKSARLGESPLGLKRTPADLLMACLRQNDPELAKLSQEDFNTYYHVKFANLDVSDTVKGHTDYQNKLVNILPGIDFNSDLVYFRERS